MIRAAPARPSGPPRQGDAPRAAVVTARWFLRGDAPQQLVGTAHTCMHRGTPGAAACPAARAELWLERLAGAPRLTEQLHERRLLHGYSLQLLLMLKEVARNYFAV